MIIYIYIKQMNQNIWNMIHENHQNSGFLKRQFGGRIAREIQIRYINDSSMNGEELKCMFWQKHVKAIVVGFRKILRHTQVAYLECS